MGLRAKHVVGMSDMKTVMLFIHQGREVVQSGSDGNQDLHALKWAAKDWAGAFRSQPVHQGVPTECAQHEACKQNVHEALLQAIILSALHYEYQCTDSSLLTHGLQCSMLCTKPICLSEMTLPDHCLRAGQITTSSLSSCAHVCAMAGAPVTSLGTAQWFYS